MIRRVNTVRGRAAAGLYSIEGTRLVQRALRAGAALETVLMSHSFDARLDADAVRLRQSLDANSITTIIAPDAIVAKLTAGRDLGAIIGLVRLPPLGTLSNLLETKATPDALFLAGVDIIDPGNAGALVRTAHAAGATAFLAAGSTDPFHPRATRISRGSIFRLPVIQFASTRDLLDALHAHAIRTLATVAVGGVNLPDLRASSGPTAVLMGNEGEGLPEGVQRDADILVTIPMPPGVDSFAVNAAAAIVLYELQRSVWQRRHAIEGRSS